MPEVRSMRKKRIFPSLSEVTRQALEGQQVATCQAGHSLTR